jgi:hypothetical protein
LEIGVSGKSQLPLKYKMYLKMISHFNALGTQTYMQNVSRKTSRIYIHLEKHKRRFKEDIKKDVARKVV